MLMTLNNTNHNQTQKQNRFLLSAAALTRGYLRDLQSKHSWKLIIPEAITLLIIRFYPRNYKVLAVGYNECALFSDALSDASTSIVNQNVKQFTELTHMSEVCDDPFSIYYGYARLLIRSLYPSKLYSAGRNSHKQQATESARNQPFHEIAIDLALPANTTTTTRVDVDSLAVISHGIWSDHQFVVTKHGTVWGFGRNLEHQLGDAAVVGRQSSPVLITSLMNERVLSSTIVQITTGNSHTLFLCADGCVYACGTNSSSQCGIIPENEAETRTLDQISKPTLVPHLSTDIRQIYSAPNSNFCVDGNHNLWVFGMNVKNIFCLPTTDARSSSLEKVGATLHSFYKQSHICVTDVSAGHYHSLCLLADSGLVYLQGENSSTQLGFEVDGDSVIGNHNHTRAVVEVGQLQASGTPFLFQADTVFANEKIAKAVCGAYHTALLTDDNELIFFGSNSHQIVAGESYQVLPIRYTREMMGIGQHTVIENIIGTHSSLVLVVSD